ncbi:class I SAM-dependent methyltransferase [Halobacteriales archaeon QS_1_69_70]|nr:MAG: class I SAM-dependent methyltransferase [Halobacteriales archaeon QS_1_69_70]
MTDDAEARCGDGADAGSEGDTNTAAGSEDDTNTAAGGEDDADADAGGEVDGDREANADQGPTPETSRAWDEYYRGDEWEREAGIAGTAGMAEMAGRFIDMVEPADFASVGCGPAAAEFELAERYPEVEFYGFDRSPAIVEDDRREADARGLDNVQFAVDALPRLETDRRFDVVYAVGMLYWVREIEDAIVDLYTHVREGGQLVVNYPNRYLHYEVLDEESDADRDVAPLVRDAENLMTFDEVGRLLGSKPRSYYTLVGAEDHRELKWPIVVVEKRG